MKVDLTLLVPDWVLQYDSWRQFLQVIEQSVNEIASNVDDLRELYDVEKAKEFIVLLVRNFGFRELVYEGLEENVQLLDNQAGFVQWKGSEEFFKWLLQLFQIVAVFEDLSKKVLMWSGGRGWDSSVIEDGKYYRDGSVEVTVPVAKFWAMKELERFISAGVYVWYMLISGVQMLGVVCGISNALPGAGISVEEVVECRIDFEVSDRMSCGWVVEVPCFAKASNYDMVAVVFGNVAPLRLEGNKLVANRDVVPLGVMFNRLLVNEGVVPLGLPSNLIVANVDAVILR
jgi:hypothetical protein